MKPPRPPTFEQRRASELEAELFARARAWIPSWGLDDEERDFGRALLKIAARFGSEVTERLDRAGEKLRLGFLDWLAVRAEAARPARLPVVFKLTDKAREAKPATALTRLQAPAAGASVMLETETDVLVLPRQLQVLVGVDGEADAFYLPPPGLTSLAPLEPLPTQWQLKSFASAGATTLQLDPEQGLAVDMLIEVGGLQYRITQLKGSIVTVDPPLSDDQAEQSVVTKVTAFMPFDGAARNRQMHALYIGHKDLFNIEAAVTIEVVGAEPLADVTWEYWSKGDPLLEDGWKPLKLASPEEQARADGLVLAKPKDPMDPRPLVKGGSESRWIRASANTVKSGEPPLLVDTFEVRINCRHGAPPPPSPDPSAAPLVEAMANTTPLVLDSVFFPFGKEPRQFDAFYLGSKEAFSKKGAEVVLDFELADMTFTALSLVRDGSADPVLAGVAQDGALYLLEVNTTTGVIGKFRGRGSMRPPPADGNADVSAGIPLNRRPQGRLPVWHDTLDPDGFLVAASADDAVWVWRENSGSPEGSQWIAFGSVPSSEAKPNAPINDIVYLAAAASTPASKLVALRGGQLSVRKVTDSAPWVAVPARDADTGKPVVLEAIAPVLVESTGVLATSTTFGMVGISDKKKLYWVSAAGACKNLEPSSVDASVRPVAVVRGDHAFIAFMRVSQRNPALLHLQPALDDGWESEESSVVLEADASVQGFDAAIDDDSKLNFLASVRLSSGGYVASWTALATGPIKPSRIEISTGLGKPAGAPTQLAGRVVIPGTGGHVLLAPPDVSLRFAGNADDVSANPELSWEYWNGTGWWKLVVTRDETLNLKTSGKIEFKVPQDLAPTDWSGRTNYWIRARLVGGDYGREKVSVVDSEPDAEGRRRQTVERSTADIHPPSVVRLAVSYELCESVLPDFVMTRDSGSLRDQSDANRTGGAKVESFVPLAVQLARLSGPPSAAATADSSIADCHCPTTTTAGGAPSSASAGGRALYLGFDAPLRGEQVNILLLVEERKHDDFAPMTVEVLIANRFVPVPIDDATRALGESGVLSMAFAIQATPRDLFGQPLALAWLRLTPKATVSPANWKPKVLGAYLNGVWASAAETLTRELVGSSQGEPDLTLFLARPPVLRNTLELRVREPLGEEERKALNEERAGQVLSAVENLPGDWVLWKRVIDPADEEPPARVYSLDEATGEIRFGDGRHGRIPPVGSDAIVAFTYRRTDAGVPGNSITARTSLNLVSPIEGVEAVFAADQGAGGAPAEDVARVLRYGVAGLRHRERALTGRDVEDLVLESSPDIAQARCFPRKGFVQLIVVMRGPNPIPSAAQVRELHRMLVTEAPPALSARQALRIGGPALRRLRVDLTLRVASLDVAGAVAREARKQINALFDTSVGGADQEGWALGENPGGADVAVALANVPLLASIAAVDLREIAADGSDQPWPQTLRSNELARLEKDGVRIQFETIEVLA